MKASCASIKHTGTLYSASHSIIQKAMPMPMTAHHRRYYSCAIEFEGFDYENAQKVEIRFGDEVIVLK
jgi:hypothetical protein